MEATDWLIERFDAERRRLVTVAYRMLGSVDDAEDAVQESWIRLTRADHSAVENISGWLTTVVSRVCLDQLRSRRTRGHQPFEPGYLEPRSEAPPQADPEQEALLAESIGMAMLVVLDTLDPAERVAFVLHDMFAVPFEEISAILERSPAAARQLASRARRRVQGADVPSHSARRQHELVSAFLAASRRGYAPSPGSFSVLLRRVSTLPPWHWCTPASCAQIALSGATGPAQTQAIDAQRGVSGLDAETLLIAVTVFGQRPSQLALDGSATGDIAHRCVGYLPARCRD